MPSKPSNVYLILGGNMIQLSLFFSGHYTTSLKVLHGDFVSNAMRQFVHSVRRRSTHAVFVSNIAESHTYYCRVVKTVEAYTTGRKKQKQKANRKHIKRKFSVAVFSCHLCLLFMKTNQYERSERVHCYQNSENA